MWLWMVNTNCKIRIRLNIVLTIPFYDKNLHIIHKSYILFQSYADMLFNQYHHEITQLINLSIVINTISSNISFKPLSRYPCDEANYNIAEIFSNAVDELPETCDDVSERDFINVVWGVSGDNVIEPRMVIKGSYQCQSRNMVWCANSGVTGPVMIGYNITEEHHMGLRMCKLLCLRACWDGCGFLHFRVMLLSLMQETQALCNCEQYIYMLWHNWYME